MSKTRNVLLGFAAAATLAALGGVGLAQPPQGAPPGPPPRNAPDRKAAPDPARHADMLRDRLKLTSEQEPALQAWLAATARQPRGGRTDRPARRAAPTLSTPERLDRQYAQAAERQTELKTRIDATKRFYASLNVEQKARFDQLPPRAILGAGGTGHMGRLAMKSRGHDRFEGRRPGRDRNRSGRDAPGAYQPQ